MEGRYHRDLQDIAIASFSIELELAAMVPSRSNLGDEIPVRLQCLQDHGIRNLNDLLIAVKTPEKLRIFAKKTGLPEDYLVNFKREIGSIPPKPVKLECIPSLVKEDIDVLKDLGIVHTKQLFDWVKTDMARRELSKKTGIPAGRILQLAKLTDVSRIKWVGAHFACLLVDSGYDTVEKVAGADYKELYSAVVAVNERRHYYRGKFGVNDMKLCVLAARNVPRGIDYSV